jgi:lipopolysaccharide assembly outer membrane protein LptD (OstA)
LLKKALPIILLAACAVFVCPSASAIDKNQLPALNFDKESKEPVVINGDTVEYNEGGKIASANGNVVITYQDLKVTCKKAMFHSDTKEVVAEGDVVLTQGDNFFQRRACHI